MRFFCFRAFTCIAFALFSWAACAEKKQTLAKPAPQAKQEKQELRMETAQLIALIKSTLMAVQHANQTGNYSVLRDLGSPVFRERYDQAQLTAIFSNLRSRGVNLTPVLFLAPNLTKQPEMTERNQLHIVGNFPTQPLQIQYELLFLQLDGVWRLDGLAVDAVPVQLSMDASAPAASSTPPTGVPAVGQAKPAASDTNKANDTKADKKAEKPSQ
jgi:hypothetical protein